MFGSLPTTGIRGKAARHRQPRNQLTERNCAQRGYGLQVEEVHEGTNGYTELYTLNHTTVDDNNCEKVRFKLLVFRKTHINLHS